MLVLCLFGCLFGAALAINSNPNVVIDEDIDFYNIPFEEQPIWFMSNYNTLVNLTSLHVFACMFDHNNIRTFASLLKNGRYESIAIVEGSFNEEFIDDISFEKLTNLKSFMLADLTMPTSELMRLLEKLPSSIEKLYVERIKDIGNESDYQIKFPEHFINIKQFHWRFMNYEPHMIQCILWAIKTANLTCLDLSGNLIEGVFYRMNSLNQYFHSLIQLILEDCSLRDIFELDDVIRKGENLERVELSGNLFESICRVNLFFKGCIFLYSENLKEVILDYNPNFKEDLSNLHRGLKDLELEELRIATKSLAKFDSTQNTSNCWKLKRLKLVLPKVDSENEYFFQRAIRYKQLEEFYLYAESMDADSFKIICSKLALAKNLTSLLFMFSITFEHIVDLSNLLKRATALTHLKLSFDDVDGYNGFLFSRNLTLLCLTLKNCKDFHDFFRTIYGPSLEELVLDVDSISSNEIYGIIRFLQCCSNLKVFKLHFNSIDKMTINPCDFFSLPSIKKFSYRCGEKYTLVLRLMEMFLTKMPNLTEFRFSIDPQLFDYKTDLINLRFNSFLQSICLCGKWPASFDFFSQFDITNCICLQMLQKQDWDSVHPIPILWVNDLNAEAKKQRTLSIAPISFINFTCYHLLPSRYPHMAFAIYSLNLFTLFDVLSYFPHPYIRMAKRRDMNILDMIFPIQKGNLRLDVLKAFLSLPSSGLVAFLSKHCAKNDTLNLLNLYALIALVLSASSNGPNQQFNIISLGDLEMLYKLFKVESVPSLPNKRTIFNCSINYLEAFATGFDGIVMIICSQYNDEKELPQMVSSIIKPVLEGHSFKEVIRFVQNFALLFINRKSMLFPFRKDMGVLYELIFDGGKRLSKFLFHEIELAPVEITTLSMLVNLKAVQKRFASLSITKDELETFFSLSAVSLFQPFPSLDSLFKALNEYLDISKKDVCVDDCTICLVGVLGSKLVYPKEVNNTNHFHGFHAECIRDWLKVKQICPTCRKPLAKIQ